MRFGIGMGHDRPLEHREQQFGVTRERIRQIKAKALSMLTHPSPEQEDAKLSDSVGPGFQTGMPLPE